MPCCPCTIQLRTNSRWPAFCSKWTQWSVLLLLLLLLWPVYYDNWRCHLKNNKKMVHLISSCAYFFLLASFYVISPKNTPVVTRLLKFHNYILKTEIRNTEMYLPEVSVSSTMDSGIHSGESFVWEHFCGIITNTFGDWQLRDRRLAVIDCCMTRKEEVLTSER